MDVSSLVTGVLNMNPVSRIYNKATGKDVSPAPAPSKFGKTSPAPAPAPKKFELIGVQLMSNTSTMNEVINYAILAFALYIAFKCKKDGKIDFVQLILAICCSPCYVAYRLVRPCNKF